ncbi:MAG: site-specific DNA-methyltransferase [Desulfobaccales bacterium]
MSALELVKGQKRQPICVNGAKLWPGDSKKLCAEWASPMCIIVDGPYGLGKFPGEPKTSDTLDEWYAPHIAAWSEKATFQTTLWFWCSELGWAIVHPILELHGWQYEECCIWNKGIAHVAGNCNSKTIRGFPVVTEVAIRYTRKVMLPTEKDEHLPIKEWLRHEWERSGLQFYLANEACGVKNAATRKYLTQCHLWYMPPPEAAVNMARYCKKHGKYTKRPYFSLDGKVPITEEQWSKLRAKWHHTHGLTNVWQEPPVHGEERVRWAGGYLHANQKPLSLMERIILASTDPGDVVWEPFGGLCSGTVAALRLGRTALSAEINETYFNAAVERLKAEEERIKHVV